MPSQLLTYVHTIFLFYAVIFNYNGPQTQVVAPGDTVVFNCHAWGYSSWYINGSDPHPQRFYEDKGFTFNYTELPCPNNQLNEFNNTITVEARPSNNNTRISCTAEGRIYGQRDFQEGALIIAGNRVKALKSPRCNSIILFIMINHC